MFDRDCMKRKYIITNDKDFWDAYKRLRNRVNTAIRNAKCSYYRKELQDQKDNPKGTWKINNSLIGRNSAR